MNTSSASTSEIAFENFGKYITASDKKRFESMKLVEISKKRDDYMARLREPHISKIKSLCEYQQIISDFKDEEKFVNDFKNTYFGIVFLIFFLTHFILAKSSRFDNVLLSDELILDGMRLLSLLQFIEGLFYDRLRTSSFK